jgi:FkbM family methyltransferase
MSVNFLTSFLRDKRILKADLKISEIPNGFEVDDRSDRIRIVNRDRARRYQFGINRLLWKLARDYGVPKYAALKRGDTILDLGANIGEFSLYAAKRGCRVFAFEPDPKVADLLRSNVSGYDVTVQECAIWKADEPVTFNLASDNADSSIMNSSAQVLTVAGRRLDTVVAELGLQRIHLIKCDAEGGEPEVLLGAKNALAKTNFITMDCGYERGSERTLETCAGLLKDYGFEIARYQEDGRCNLVARNRHVL